MKRWYAERLDDNEWVVEARAFQPRGGAGPFDTEVEAWSHALEVMTEERAALSEAISKLRPKLVRLRKRDDQAARREAAGRRY